MAKATLFEFFHSFRFSFRVRKQGGEWSIPLASSRIISDFVLPRIIVERAIAADRNAFVDDFPAPGELEVTLFQRPAKPGELPTVGKVMLFTYDSVHYIPLDLGTADKETLALERVLLNVREKELKVYADACATADSARKELSAVLDGVKFVSFSEDTKGLEKQVVREAVQGLLSHAVTSEEAAKNLYSLAKRLNPLRTQEDEEIYDNVVFRLFQDGYKTLSVELDEKDRE